MTVLSPSSSLYVAFSASEEETHKVDNVKRNKLNGGGMKKKMRTTHDHPLYAAKELDNLTGKLIHISTKRSELLKHKLLIAPNQISTDSLFCFTLGWKWLEQTFESILGTLWARSSSGVSPPSDQNFLQSNSCLRYRHCVGGNSLWRHVRLTHNPHDEYMLTDCFFFPNKATVVNVSLWSLVSQTWVTDRFYWADNMADSGHSCCIFVLARHKISFSVLRLIKCGKPALRKCEREHASSSFVQKNKAV